MNGTAARFLRFGMALSGLVVLGWVLTGSAAKPAKHGISLPSDWSHQYMVFSRPGTAEELARVSKDPRYQQQMYRREQALMLPANVGNARVAALMAQFSNKRRKQLKRDWSEFLGTFASAGAGNYPAKFSFDTTTANCGDAATPDYVVYSTGLTGSATQASLVAYDNIYAGCSSLNLGTAANFAVLSSSPITNTGETVVTGANIGVSPGTTVSGFPPGILTPPAVEHLGDAVATQAQADAQTAFTFYQGLTGATPIDSLDGLSLAPGLYKGFATSLALSSGATVTLNGKGTYIFQVDSTLELAGSVVLENGARASDIVWLVGSSATLDGTAVAVGSIIAQTSITMDGGASLAGRAIALTGSITLIDNAITSSINSVPSVYWAYNTGGRIATSPVLSLDGKQVAFVETTGTVGILTMLKWAAAPLDTIGAPETLTPVDNSSYPGCTAPCMTQVFLHGGGGVVSTDDTTSWAYYDYANDVAWVGGTAGWLHKVTGVFKGTPAEVDDDLFPVQLSTTAAWLSSPIYDSVSNNVFVGDSDGFLYSVNATLGTVTKSARLDFGAGLVAPPLVDSTHQLVYVFSSSDNSADCGGDACAAVYQLSTSFTANVAGTKVIVGSAGPGVNPNPLYAGAFDSSYYNSTNGTGNLYVCGNTGAVPTLYAIHFTAGIPGSASSGATLATGGSTAACSPVTDVPSPSQTAVQSERLFFSVQGDGVPLCANSAGCVYDLLDTPWQPLTTYADGQRVFSKNLHVETVLSGGTSGGITPIWTSIAGTQTSDGGVTWIDQGSLNQALTNNWQANHTYTAAYTHFIDSNGNIEVSTTPGVSGSSQPIWSTTVGGTTQDNFVTWTNAGAAGIAVLPAAGGGSGMIIDNTVNPGPGSSPANMLGASQVYFTTLSDQLCATSGGTGGCAVQASQAALQ